MNKCKACGSDQIKIGITNLVSGATVYPYYCAACGKVHQQYAKKHAAQQYATTHGPLEYVQTNTQRYLAAKNISVSCAVCDAPEGELHHWAPRHLFGDECDQWPQAYLCRACHARWHALVTPSMSQNKNNN